MSEQKPKGKTRIRSPKYPSINLENAIERARKFFDFEKNGAAPPAAALGHWGYSPDSSPGLRLLAALIQYGLLAQEGTGASRKVRITELGKKLVLDERSEAERDQQAIQEAALKPKIFRQIWEKHGPELPSDATLAHELKVERDFNPDIVPSLIKALRATVEFAKLGKGDIMSSSDRVESTPPDSSTHEQNGQDNSRQCEQWGNEPLPETQRQDSRSWDLAIPLIEGGQAMLRTPIPLSETDYNLLVAMLESNLKAAKQAITKPTLNSVFYQTLGKKPPAESEDI